MAGPRSPTAATEPPGEPARLPRVLGIALPVPFAPGGAVNAYLLRPQPITLVDPGPAGPEVEAALTAGLAAAGLSLAAVEQVVVTHSHLDHGGGAAAVAAAAGARLLGHPLAAGVLNHWPAAWAERRAHFRRAAVAAAVPAELLQAFEALAAERENLVAAGPGAPFTALSQGATLRAGGRAWRVLHTPGHSPDHLCLAHAGAGEALVGDVLLRSHATVPLLDPRRGPGQPPALAELVRSWRGLGRLRLRVAWPGHGEAIRAHRILVARRLAGTQSRLRAARRAVEAGADTVWAVSGALGLPATAETLPGLLGETVGLLELLAWRGAISRAVREGIVRYAPLAGKPG